MCDRDKGSEYSTVGKFKRCRATLSRVVISNFVPTGANLFLSPTNQYLLYRKIFSNKRMLQNATWS